MGNGNVSWTIRVGTTRFSVHLDEESCEVELFDLPEHVPDTPEGIQRMLTPLAQGKIEGTAVRWTMNTVGAAADAAAACAIKHVDEANRLLLFIDETGTDDLSDPNYPVFGLGGCAVRADDYLELVAGPWRVMKARRFGGLEVPLHAAELRNPTQPQVEAIGELFRTGRFYRVAAVASKATTVGSGFRSIYEAVGTMMLRNLAAVLNRVACSGVTTVFESSERGDRQAKAFFPLVRANGQGGELPLRWGALKKAAGEPGLEVADFIMHAAGTQVRARHNGKKGYRKDFQAVFSADLGNLVEFGAITSVDIVHNPNGTIDAVLIDPMSEIIGRREW